MPLVSVIVPVYNAERFLTQCMDSLVNQTLDDIEIIAVNDASPDGSLAILRDYEARFPGKVVVIDSPENRRQGGARNLGLDAARGEYVGFVDSDDWVDVTMYEKLYARASATGADIVDCDYTEWDPATNRHEPRYSNTSEQTGPATTASRRSLILRSGRIWTKIVRRGFLEEHAVRYPEHLAFEDNAITVYWCLAKRLERVPEHLYVYRRNEGSTVRARSNHAYFDRLTTAQMMVENAKRSGVYDTFPEEIDEYFIEQYYVTTIGVSLFNFDRPQSARLEEMRRFVRTNYPRYRANPYFRRLPLTLRAMTKVNDAAPGVLVAAARIVRATGLEKAARWVGVAFIRRRSSASAPSI